MQPILLRDIDASADSSLDAYLHEGGYQAWAQISKNQSAERLIDIIEEAGLRGKGGAGFPAHRKMRLMLAQSAEKKFLIINGSEHEPGSLKDRFLLEHNPHRVLEGALLSARAVKASDVVVAINEASVESVQQFLRALNSAQCDSRIDFAGITVTVQTVPDIYIVGEESALLEVLEGKKPLPRKKPPFPIQQGLHGFPTLIHNVETVAHLPFIASAGAAAYRNLGINGQGVTLCTLGDEFVRPGVYEVPLGTPIDELLSRWGGGLRGGLRIKAIQPGGPSAGFLMASQLNLPLDADVLQAHGSALGCAVIKAYSDQDCMVHEIGQIMHFFSHGSCGQCPRCRMETNMLDTIVRQILSGKGNWKLVAQIDNVIGLAKGEGICSLITMPVAPVQTGLKYFREEFAAHIDHQCPICTARRDDGGNASKNHASHAAV